MKKIIISLGILATASFVFALSSNDLITKLNSFYNKYTNQATNYYKEYTQKIQTLKTKLSTGDYLILTKLTWCNLSWLSENFKEKYTNVIKKLTDSKYQVLADIETNDNNFKNWLISTGEYENNLKNLETEVTNYGNTASTNVNLFVSYLSGNYSNFVNNLNKKLDYYKTDIEKYKNYEKLLKQLENNYNKLLENYNKLQNIIWLSKDVFNEKSEQLKKFIDSYYSGLLENEFKKYLEQDPNMSYFESGFKLKKQILLWYINNQFNDTINKIINSYYPDIDIKSLKSQINELKNKKITEIISNYSTLIPYINSLEKTISDYEFKINQKLQKFPKQDKWSILKVLEKDLINFLDKATKLIQEDINETLKWWLVFLQTREKVEQPLIEKITQIYTTNINSNDINKLEQVRQTIQAYQQVIILPTNKQIINNYLKIINQKIQELKVKEITEKLQNILTQLDIIPIGNKKKLEELENQFNQVKESLKDIDNEKINNLIKEIELKIKLKENLNKLYDCQAIKFYYQYWDLSNTVENLLNKFYEKYIKEWKANLFMEKINKALEKIQLLEENLNDDIRSYYIIMIHNWILKFKAKLQNND